ELVDVELDLKQLPGADAGEGEGEEHEQGVPLADHLRQRHFATVLVGEGEVGREVADHRGDDRRARGHRRPTRRCACQAPSSPTGTAPLAVRPAVAQASWMSCAMT